MISPVTSVECKYKLSTKFADEVFIDAFVEEFRGVRLKLTSFVTIKLGTTEYKGVMIEQTLEPTDEQTIAFTCMNRNGVTVWGYQSSPATGIEEVKSGGVKSGGVKSSPSTGSGADKWFDLQGRRINTSSLRPGLYIKNGKKILIK